MKVDFTDVTNVVNEGYRLISFIYSTAWSSSCSDILLSIKFFLSLISLLYLLVSLYSLES